MSSLPSQFLQIRDLHPDATAQHIATALVKLQDVAIRRLLLLSGRQDEHVPVAFAEFLDSNAAGHALAMAAALPGKGFSVKGKPVGLSYVHEGVFVPVYGNVKAGVFKATNSAQLLSYWNQDYTCFVHIPDGAIPEDDGQISALKRKGSHEHVKRKKTKVLGTGVTINSGSGGMISHWSKKQEELKSASSMSRMSYADTNIMACLLCSRKFKTENELNQHEGQSDLHRNNLQNEALVKKAQERLATKYQVTNKDTNPATVGTAYRDRALERRTEIKRSGEPLDRPTARHKHPSIRAKSPPSPPQPKAPSKGSQLLSKMGYVSGGLGSSGQGRAEAIKPESYITGVGLGMAGAKLDERALEARASAATSYSAFVASVKDNARIRYDNEQNHSA